MVTCPSCGKENPDGFQFCGFCTGPLTEQPAPSVQEERKVVTVLFCDLVGFTARAERLDPEEVRAVLRPYHDRVRAELERHGGTVEKFIGDAAMALFGAPTAHEDDPERAVRAAFAIRDFALEEGLELRIGVTTGEALIALGARPAEGEGMASGDVVNTAARLQSAAPVHGILVDEPTQRATRNVIDFREVEAIDAKGKSAPIAVWEAIAPRSEIGVDVVQAGRTPLIGREHELEVLLSTARRVREGQEAQLVTLVGVPGIGKSRLTFELFEAVTGDGAVVWRQGRCLPYGDGVAFWAIGEIVKSHAQIFESDSAARADEKLLAVAAASIADVRERDWVAGHLRTLVGIGSDHAAMTGESKADAFLAFRRFFEALAEERPLVLVIEDLHWADNEFLDFIDELVEWVAGVPLLLVCTARPELLERRPDWGGGMANATTLSLRPLSDEDTARLLSASLERPILEAGMQAALLERAGGNPLYAEQYARMLLERDTGEELTVPESVQAIVAARLDSLTPEDKALLLDAAVHGKVFWVGAVANMAGADRAPVEERLHALERKEFVRRQRRSAVAGEAEYAFRHIVLRDVAYGQIPRGARAEKHRLAAEWIASLVADRDDHVELLADHYARALELTRAVGGDETLVVERARVAFRDAGERAFALHAIPAAVRYYQQAVELWPEDDPELPELLFSAGRAELLLEDAPGPLIERARAALLRMGNSERAAEAEMLIALGLKWHGNDKLALERSAQAVAALEFEPASEAKTFVLANHARLLAVTDNGDGENSRAALAAGANALAIAEELELDELRANALHTIGLAHVDLGEAGGIEELEEGTKWLLEHGSPLEVARSLNNLSMSYETVGRLEDCENTLRRKLDSVTRLGLRGELRFSNSQLAFVCFTSGAWEEATRRVDQGLADVPAAPDVEQSILLYLLTVLRFVRGETEAAATECARALDIARALGEALQGEIYTAWLAFSLSIGARIAVARQQRLEAEALASELADVLPGALLLFPGTEILELFCAVHEVGLPSDILLEAAEARPYRVWLQPMATAARGQYADAAEALERLGAKPYAAYMRIRAAEQLVAGGSRIEADRQLDRALAFYRPVGAARFVREAEALLGEGETAAV